MDTGWIIGLVVVGAAVAFRVFLWPILDPEIGGAGGTPENKNARKRRRRAEREARAKARREPPQPGE